MEHSSRIESQLQILSLFMHLKMYPKVHFEMFWLREPSLSFNFENLFPKRHLVHCFRKSHLYFFEITFFEILLFCQLSRLNFIYTRSRITLNSLISNYRLFRRPPSTPKITPLTKICFTPSQLHQKMAKIRLSRIKSSAFKISSYAGPSVYCTTRPIMHIKCSIRQ